MLNKFEDPEGQTETVPDQSIWRTLYGASNCATAFDPAMGTWTIPGESRAKVRDHSDLRLKRWRESDAKAYHALLDDPEMWRFLPETYPDPLTLSDARSLIAIASGLPHHIVRAVWKDQAPVGQVRVEFTPRSPREAEISYWIGRDYWGEGISRHAVRLFTKEVFEARPDIAQLIARVHPGNAASRAVIQGAGFVFQEKRDDANGWHIFARRR